MNHREFLKTCGVILGSIMVSIDLFADTKEAPIFSGLSEIDFNLAKYDSNAVYHENYFFLRGMLRAVNDRGYKIDYVKQIDLGLIKIKDGKRTYEAYSTLFEIYGQKGKMPLVGKIQVRKNGRTKETDYDFRTVKQRLEILTKAGKEVA